ncbi:polymorphic toxin-type HINT domain-containing protein [Streptomyces sp. NPDC021020]|uniref:polymorphic toxin-type HINT domain-containing protein n=1 Tax=Streptomyces sp. NPDC021020 TaxID=3365109 RepID=UPI0037BA7FFA
MTVPVAPVAFGGSAKRPNAAAVHGKAPAARWPAAGQADASPARAPVRAGTLPVRVADPSGALRTGQSLAAKVRVAVADRATAQRAGVDGLLLSVNRSDGSGRSAPLDVDVDYADFKDAYGGDWAARLHLAQLPACALTTPDEPGCQVRTPVPTTNDTTAATLSAQVTATAGPTVLAAEAGASGSSGTYAATSLNSSGTWSAGGSTGAFNWSYPMAAPAVPGGLQPDVSFGYSSQAVDGRTSASNNQPSWIGDGWSYEPGFVERSYKPCDDDQDGGTNTTKVGDECWYNDNATLSLGGKSTELVHDASRGWHPADDSGEKVEKLDGAVNGDDNGEYWKITTTDGTQYYFGLNRLPGWTGSTTPETDSAWTVPVFGNQSGEPCYDASFASAWCQQAWRWQLDYVVDVHGDAMAYYWNKETNRYGRDVSSTTGDATPTSYTRGGYLDHIDYGLRKDAVYSGKAMGKVLFATDERCLSGCGTFDADHAANWPDTPVDQYCKDGATECKDQYAPTFWSRRRLTQVTTQVLTGGAYKDVDSWKLSQGFPPAGDGISTPMWLNSITRTGHDLAGGSLSLPAVTFAGEQHANRVDKTGDGLAPFVRLRMSEITTETGGTIGVYYDDPGCTAAHLPPADATNTTACYPVKWEDGDNTKTDWFNTYPVERVVEGDNLADTPDKVTSYAYLQGAAWGKSTDELTKAADRTYSVSRGYGLVQTRTGAGSDPRTLSEARYFRGIDGAAVKDSTGAAVTDREQFAGMEREIVTYDGDDTSKPVTATAYTPWRSAPTAVRARSDLPDLVAYHTGPADQQNRTTVTGGTRTTATHTTYDAYGMVSTVSSTGDTQKTGDETCATTTYARNTDLWLLDKPAETENVDRPCGTDATLPDDILGHTRTYYDGATSLTAAPTKGDVTKVEQINGTGTGYDQVSASPADGFDIYGRALQSADAYGKVTTTTYTPATGETATLSVVTNPLKQTTTTVVDPVNGQVRSTTDANNRVTSTTYDALGRATQRWTPAHTQADFPDRPSYTYAYTVRNDGPVVVTTQTLNYQNVYRPGYAFYDGMLRAYQTQAPSPDGSGRLVTETLYDTRGTAWRGSGTYYADGAAEPVPVTGEELHYPASTDTVYDGAGRVVKVVNKKFGDPVETTTTSYTGDTITVVPPAGGTAVTTVVDALGRATAVEEYTDTARTRTQTTTSTYDAHGRLTQVQDPTGAKWTYSFDVRGRKTGEDDPDKGHTTTAYDQGDRITDVTDPRGYTLHSDYDSLGRQTKLTSTYQGATTTLSEWTYDTATGGIGQPAKSVQYVGGQPYTSEVTSYTSLYAPAVSQVTVPGTGGLAGTYKWTTAYYPTGQVKWIRQPALGGLPQEDVTPLYTANEALPVTLSAGSDALVSNTVYDHYGRITREELGAFGQRVYNSYEYDEHTGALTDQITDRDTASQRVDATHYTHDPAGNVTSITDTTGQDAAAVTDTQCFVLDALRRVTDAWTPGTGGACAGGPSAATVGGPDAYWTSYSYDASGDRTSETQHATASGPAVDTVRTYAAPAAGTHQLSRVTQTGTAPHIDSYTYDAAGNTETRTSDGGSPQSLDWNAQGHLASVTQGATTLASYTYDAGGNRLTGTDSSGTTLYLPDGNELLLKPDSTLVGTRYYDFNGTTVAMRSGGKLTYLIADAHGTATTQIDAATQAVTRRRTTIFGAPRGASAPGWQGTKGFVGGTTDAATGLTHLGAREYDPATGRFVSVDPLLDFTDSQQINGYAYADNNPTSMSDPTGQIPDDCFRLASCHLTSSGWVGETTAQAKRDQAENEAHKKWVKAWAPPTKDSQDLSADLFKYMRNSPLGDSYWDTPDGATGKPHSVCFGRTACNKAYVYLLENPDDIVGAKDIAATYCLVHYAECTRDARNFEASRKTMGEAALLFAGGEGAAVADGVGTAEKDFASALEKVIGDDDAIGQCSFDPDTRILLKDGRTKPIEDVRVGDEVESANPENGKHRGARQVTATFVHLDSDLVDVVVLNGDGTTATLHTTNNHPFWDDSAHAWTRAGALPQGHHLVTDTNASVTVAAIRHLPSPAQDMYNFTVEGLHTYYVLAGGTAVLVHNTGAMCFTAGNPRVRPMDAEQKGDIVVDDDGFVHPPSAGDLQAVHVRGLSVFDTIAHMEDAGLTGRPMVTEGPLPDGLAMIADDEDAGGSMPTGHSTIYPTRSMPFEEFENLINSMEWERGGPNMKRKK